MKKIAFAALALAVSAASAIAADLPSRKAPVLPPPPPPMWTGFYAGLNAGGTWNASNTVTPNIWGINNANFPESGFAAAALATSFPRNGSNFGGFIGGGQIGYNWQVGLGAGNFVTGIEADIQGIAGNSGTSSGFGVAVDPAEANNPFLAASTYRKNVQYLGTVRGRLGYLVMPTLLVYGTGGLAYGGVTLNTAHVVGEANEPDVAVGAINYSNTQVGWTAGGGLEWMFLPNWSVKAEYLYYDLGNVQASTLLAANAEFANPVNVQTRFNGNIVRAGVNYHFNWSAAPVVAKY